MISVRKLRKDAVVDRHLRAAAVDVLKTWNDYIMVDLDDPATDDHADGEAFEAHVAALRKMYAALYPTRRRREMVPRTRLHA